MTIDGILYDTAYIPFDSILIKYVTITLSNEFIIHHINEFGISNIEYFNMSFNTFLSKIFNDIFFINFSLIIIAKETIK